MLPYGLESAALYLDPRNRLINHGPDALSKLDTLALLFGEHGHLLATRLLLNFGSLIALSRASLTQLSPLLSPEKAMRLVCSFTLGTLCASRQAATHRLDSPERIYDLFAAELMQLDREVLCLALRCSIPIAQKGPDFRGYSQRGFSSPSRNPQSLAAFVSF